MVCDGKSIPTFPSFSPPFPTLSPCHSRQLELEYTECVYLYVYVYVYVCVCVCVCLSYTQRGI